jgi:hypothetical protein
MEAKFKHRLDALLNPWCDADFIEELLGVDVLGDARLGSEFRSWSARFLGASQVERPMGQGPQVHRHHLETFLLQNGLVSWKWAAVNLGLDTITLKTVVDRLEGIGSVLQLRTTFSDQLVRQREAALLFRAFPRLRGVLFSNHSRMCHALHEAIRTELKIDVEPVLCVTSAILDATPDTAAVFDAITLDPVGLRYQVWLDTKKPISLRADVCSLKFYAQHESELRDYVMAGSVPEQVDDRLRAA